MDEMNEMHTETETEASKQFCAHCGKALKAGVQFCDNCGTPVGGSCPNTQTPPPPAPPAYTAPPVDASPLSTGQFFLMQFLFSLPLVGFILMLVWGLGGGTNLNRRNLSRSYLIWWLIYILLYILLIVLIVVLVTAGIIGSTGEWDPAMFGL